MSLQTIIFGNPGQDIAYQEYVNNSYANNFIVSKIKTVNLISSWYIVQLMYIMQSLIGILDSQVVDDQIIKSSFILVTVIFILDID